MDTWIGQQLGPYELQGRLGAGGMGVVYRAVHRRLGQARAIKVLPTALAHDETFVQRFEREARLASELRHPNIVMIYDIAEEHGVHYIVMELLQGRSLHEIVRQDGPIPVERGVRLLRQLADALDFAHQHGVVHRDVKPGNALVGPDDHLTLVDFGIARAAEGTRLTEASMRIGTAEYMAPETITLGESGPGTDLYALGVIAYELLTGRVPFTGVNSQTIMYAQIHTQPPPPRSVRTDLSPAVEQVVLRQLDKDPARRYPTGRAFVEALAAASTGASPAGAEPDESNGDARLAPTALLDGAGGRGRPPGGSPPPVAGPPGTRASGEAASTGPGSARPPRPGASTGARTPTALTGSSAVPPPPVTPSPVVADPVVSGIHRALGPARHDAWTVYRLAIGAAVLVLLAMTLLPTPHDPLRLDSQARLAFPFGVAGGHVLGGDALGRDVLSRLMAGGRFLLLRLCVVGLLATAAALVLRRRLQRRTGHTWPGAPALILLVTSVLAASVLSEAAIGLFARPDSLQYLWWLGRIVLGVPLEPPAASWGGMLIEGRQVGTQAPWLVVFPAAGLILVAVGLALFGSGLAALLKQRARAAAPLPRTTPLDSRS